MYIVENDVKMENATQTPTWKVRSQCSTTFEWRVQSVGNSSGRRDHHTTAAYNRINNMFRCFCIQRSVYCTTISSHRMVFDVTDKNTDHHCNHTHNTNKRFQFQIPSNKPSWARLCLPQLLPLSSQRSGAWQRSLATENGIA